VTVITCWTYRDGHLSGMSPAVEADVNGALRRAGHVILTDSRTLRPLNHHLIGAGVGHDDAEFAEAGRSMAAYYENGEAWGGRWWEGTDLPYSPGVTYYGCTPRPYRKDVA